MCRAAQKAREDAQKVLAHKNAAGKGATVQPVQHSHAYGSADHDGEGGAGIAASGRARSGSQNMLTVGSELNFTPITVVWRDLNYYVAVPKGLTGAAALNIMPEDAGDEIKGKKRLLHNITGAR